MDPRTVRFLDEIERDHGPSIREVVRRFVVGEIGYMRQPTRHVKKGWTTREPERHRKRKRETRGE